MGRSAGDGRNAVSHLFVRGLGLPCTLALLLLSACAGNPFSGGQASAPDTESVGRAAVPANLSQTLAELDALPCPKGVSAETWAGLKGAMREALAKQGQEPRAKGQGKAGSAVALGPPHGDAAASTLVYSAAGALLNWGYYSPGDCDQNGEVGLSDLVPLAVHFGESTLTGNPFPEYSIQSVIDGDANGEINLGDIIAIAANFGVHAEGYRVYSASNPSSHPPSADDPNGVGTVYIAGTVFSAGAEPPGGGRKTFNYQVVPTATAQYYWVRPFDAESDGAASNYVVVALPPKRAPIAHLAYPPTAETLAYIVWNAQTSFDPDGVITRYEWDFNDDGVYEYDSGAVPTADYYYYAPGTYTCTVRVTDNDFYTATASGMITVTEKAKWRVNVADERPVAAQSEHTFTMPTLLDAGGMPGLFYMRSTGDPEASPYVAESSLVYTRALDSHGESWAAPIILDTQAQPEYNKYETLSFGFAAVVEGKPAVVFGRSIDDNTVPQRTMTTWLYYLRASDEFGQSWPQPQVLNYAEYYYMYPQDPIVGTRFNCYALLIVRGRPALFGSGPSEYCWMRAQDSIGSSWAEPRVVGESYLYLQGSLGDSEILAAIGGLPAKARSAGEDLLYSHAIDPDQPE